MDLKSRKLEFIQEFLKVQSEDTIALLEKILSKAREANKEGFEAMSMEEFNSRIDRSLKDSSEGKLTEVNDLLAEIEKWG